MEWLGVLRRIDEGEGAQTAFARTFDGSPAAGNAICAFANSNGGFLVIGVDESRTITSVKEEPRSVRERLTSFLQTGCGQPVSAVHGCHDTGDGWVHWVEIPRQRRWHQPFAVKNRFWIRRGHATVSPSRSELQELFNAFGYVLTESQMIPSAAASDIDLGAFHAFMREQGKNIVDDPQPPLERDLRNASVCDTLDGVLRPTLYGLMAFGRTPQEHIHIHTPLIGDVLPARVRHRMTWRKRL